jgi:predicted Rossmann-fold nucleotide-binding protein
MVVLSGEAEIAIDGSYGTLSEIAYALIHNIPVVGIDTWDFNYHGFQGDRVVRVMDAAAAVDTAMALAKQRQEEVSE